MSDQTALERAQLVVQGDRAELRVEGGRVTITKQAPTSDGPTTVEFDVGQVRDAQLETPARGVRGWLHVSVVGGSPAPPGELAAVGDPYTLPLAPRSAGAARRFAKLVERHVRERGMPHDLDANGGRLSSGVAITDAPTSGPPGPPPPPPMAEGAAGRRRGPEGPTSGPELVAELQALADLRASGALTEEEFEHAKARVLG